MVEIYKAFLSYGANMNALLKQVLTKLDSIHLGVCEDEVRGMTERHTIQFGCTDVVRHFIMQYKSSFNKNYFWMLTPQITRTIDMIFTSSKVNGMPVSNIINITANNVIDAFIPRNERVIFNCSIEGITGNFVLKCMQTRASSLNKTKMVTVIENEAASYQNDKIKSLFAEKYGHGRLWLEDHESCEVILMQRLSQDNLFTRLKTTTNPEQKLQYLIDAYKLLLELHKQGYAHLDCHHGNVMWTDNTYKQTRFIDPDRVKKLGPKPSYRKNLLLLYDLHYMLFLQNDVLNEMIGDKTYIMRDTTPLRKRLISIKKHNPLFFLDGIILFDSSLIDNIDNTDTLSVSVSKYPDGYRRLAAANLDTFMLSLQDTYIMKMFLTYIARQTVKAYTNPDSFDVYDLESWTSFCIGKDINPWPDSSPISDHGLRDWRPLLRLCRPTADVLYNIMSEEDNVLKDSWSDPDHISSYKVEACLRVFGYERGQYESSGLRGRYKELCFEFHPDKVAPWCMKHGVYEHKERFVPIFNTAMQIINRAKKILDKYNPEESEPLPQQHKETTTPPPQQQNGTGGQTQQHPEPQNMVQTKPLTYLGNMLFAPENVSDPGQLSYYKNGAACTCYRSNVPFPIITGQARYMWTITANGLQRIFQNPQNKSYMFVSLQNNPIPGYYPLIFMVHSNPPLLRFAYEYGPGQISQFQDIPLP